MKSAWGKYVKCAFSQCFLLSERGPDKGNSGAAAVAAAAGRRCCSAGRQSPRWGAAAAAVSPTGGNSRSRERQTSWYCS